MCHILKVFAIIILINDFMSVTVGQDDFLDQVDNPNYFDGEDVEKIDESINEYEYMADEPSSFVDKWKTLI